MSVANASSLSVGRGAVPLGDLIDPDDLGDLSDYANEAI
jgi:hypothetical protein